MYCPVCGAESTQGLNYCKRCGAGLTSSGPPIEHKSGFGRTMAMLLPVALVSIAGFIALFSTVYALGDRATFDTKALVALAAFGGATVVAVIGLLVWLLLRLNEPLARQEKTGKTPVREYNAPQLQAPPIGLSSVTENTTRNFEPRGYRERESRE